VLERIRHLPERESRILEMRFGLPPFERSYTLRQIAAEVDLSRERVRQIEHQALACLRRDLGESPALPTPRATVRRA
jgi:RNA polymerase nonessential primary-like sigma factor